MDPEHREGGLLGTCIGVFMLAIADMCFFATAAAVNVYWNKK